MGFHVCLQRPRQNPPGYACAVATPRAWSCDRILAKIFAMVIQPYLLPENLAKPALSFYRRYGSAS